MTIEPGQAGQDRRDLAQALRTLRQAAGLSGERLAVRCGMSQSKISRIETGRVLPTVVDVQQIVNALGLDGDTAAELLSLARAANTEFEEIRASVRRGLDHRQRELASLEATATTLHYFVPADPTGLLQTAECMLAAMSPVVDEAPHDPAPVITLKLDRQAVLHDSGKRFVFLLTESAVRWRMCPPNVMALQIDRLVSLSRLPSLSIEVIPLAQTVSEVPFQTFTIYDRTLVTIELSSGRIAVREPRDIKYDSALFAYLRTRAEKGDSARRLLGQWADGFRAEGE